MSQLRRAPGFVVAFVLGCLVTALLMGRTTVGQVQGRPPQIAAPMPPLVVEDHYFQTTHIATKDSMVVLINPVTGQCWSRLVSGQGSWNDLGTPLPPKR
jgi:hypothetical protein